MKARFTGVSKKRPDGTFLVTMRVLGKMHKLGTWLREVDAAVAFDRASLWFGRDGSLNLPAESRALGPCSPEDLRRIARSQRKSARGCSSQFRGVSWDPRRKAWFTVVHVDGVTESGIFETEVDAAMAYDRLLIKLGGDRARLNFPSRQQQPTPASELRAEADARRKRKRTSLFHGVSMRPDGRWQAEISHEGCSHGLGHWNEESAAAEAFDRAALFFRGPEARRNFPTRRLSPTAPAELRAEAVARTKVTRTSRYWGVTWVEAEAGYSGWRAELVRAGVHRLIGRFDDEREAAVAYDRVARAWFGDEAKLNFPNEPWPATSLEDLRAEQRARFKETTTSRHTGVSWVASLSTWRAWIQVDGVLHFLGSYDDEVAAARAYDRKRRELRGEGPYNFPDAIPDGPRRARPRRRRRSQAAR